MADQQSNRPHRPKKEKKPQTADRNPKAFAFSAPGKLKKAAARSTEVCDTSALFAHHTRLTSPGQRKAPPRPARRPPPRRSAPNHCRCRRSSRCGKNYTHQELDQAIHQADAFHAHRSPHSRYLEAPAPHLHRMPRRLPRQHDRHRKSSRHMPVDD